MATSENRRRSELMNINVYESIVNESILAHFSEPKGKTLMNHAANSCGIEETLAVAAVFWPALIEIEDCIFIKDFFSGNIENFHQLIQQFNGNKQSIERFVNAWSLADFFLLADSPSVHDDALITMFGSVLNLFWEKRLKELFPTKNFIFEIGEAIEGERGLTITFYQSNG